LSDQCLRIRFENIRRSAKKLDRVAVASEAELHAERLGLIDHRHLVDLAMAFDAADTSANVRRVVKVDIIGDFVHLDPRHRLAVFIACAHNGQQRALWVDQLVTIHAGLCSWKIGETRSVDVAVAVAAVEAELPDVQTVIVGHWLNRRIADAKILRREIIRDPRRDDRAKKEKIEDDL